MSEVEQQLEGVELSIEEARGKIERAEQLSRLEKNKDFKALILDHLLRENAITQVRLLAAPALKAAGEQAKMAREGIEARIDMIGELTNFFRWTHMEAETAKQALEEHQDTRAELLAEQLEED